MRAKFRLPYDVHDALEAELRRRGSTAKVPDVLRDALFHYLSLRTKDRPRYAKSAVGFATVARGGDDE